MSDPRRTDYFGIAASPRFRASRRTRVREASRQGMILTVGVAVLDIVWLVSSDPDAAGFLLAVNLTLAVGAVLGYLALATFARRRPEAVVFVALVAVDTGTAVVGLSNPTLGLLVVGYLLLLPAIVSLVIPWAWRIHVTWLGLHAAYVLGYAMLAPSASVPGGAREQLLELLIVALVVSLSGHVTGLRGRVQSFKQIERIKALNRAARRDRVGLDRLNAALERSSTTDALTGLGNRFSLDAGLSLARSRIERHHDWYGLLVLDLDRFKAINDAHGHLRGDEVLRATGDALRRVLREGDTAYRYGGEEFVVLLRVTGPPDVLAAADRIRRAIEDLQIPNPANTPFGYLTTSVGATSIGPGDAPADDPSWLARADAALYRAKANGRNRCEVGPNRHRPLARRPGVERLPARLAVTVGGPS